jgi:hypothetical protein
VRDLDRLALGTTLALLWINLATTGRWAEIPGSLHGARLPWYAGALAITTMLAMRRPSTWWGAPAWLPRAVLIGGVALLALSFILAWMPPGDWTQIPFQDDWPPRFWSTVEGIRLLGRGAVTGWQWHFLGGYSTAADVTQGLTILGALPMTIFGATIGFHVLHLLLCLALPAIVFVDLDRRDTRTLALTAAGLVALGVCGLSWPVIRTGDTNALTGLVMVMATLAASQRARARARLGLTVLVIVLAITAYAHVGFFAYAVGLLVLEAFYYRDGSHVHRSMIAALLAVVISLPQTFELFRYASFFNFNSVLYAPPAHINWAGVLLRVGYNTQILFLPHRWFNDAGGLTSLFLPVLILAAWRREGRAGFYAWAALFAVVLMRFNVPEAGEMFAPPLHLLVAFTPVVIAWFMTTRAWSGALAVALLAVVAIACRIVWFEVPHQPSVDAFLAKLVNQVAASDGNLVLVENNPRRNVVATPAASGESPVISSEPSLYGTHFEALLPAATGRRLYAGAWDGWTWVPYRGRMLAGGAWQGHLLSDDDHAAFVAEMRTWGVRDLFVWSGSSVGTIGRWPEFVERGKDDAWHQFEFIAPGVDARSVVTDHGTGELASTDPLGGVVRLHDVEAGDHVVVRTHFHPSWEAEADGHAIDVGDANGQLAFTAPRTGSYDVTLIYPRRPWLFALALGVIVGVAMIETFASRR